MFGCSLLYAWSGSDVFVLGAYPCVLFLWSRFCCTIGVGKACSSCRFCHCKRVLCSIVHQIAAICAGNVYFQGPVHTRLGQVYSVDTLGEWQESNVINSRAVLAVHLCFNMFPKHVIVVHCAQLFTTGYSMCSRVVALTKGYCLMCAWLTDTKILIMLPYSCIL